MEVRTLNSAASLGVNTLTDPMSAQRLTSIADPRQRAEALADQLESVFSSMMLKAMRDTVPQGGLLGRGLGGENYVQMLDQQMAQMGVLPRDPRFHEALVNQILQSPGEAAQALNNMKETPGEGQPATPANRLRSA
jgi:Rod binding domain-containing protein